MHFKKHWSSLLNRYPIKNNNCLNGTLFWNPEFKLNQNRCNRAEWKGNHFVVYETFLPVSALACTSKVLYGCPLLSIPKTSTVYCVEGKSPVISVFSSFPCTILWTTLLTLFMLDFNKTIKCCTWLPRRTEGFVHWTEKLDDVSLLIANFQPKSTGAEKQQQQKTKQKNKQETKSENSAITISWSIVKKDW